MPNPPHRHIAECVSTNDLARLWAQDADDPAPHGASLRADFQTAGRGRRGRTWTAAPGESVLLSVVLRPAFSLPDAWRLAFAGALAVADALEERDLCPRLKWPNDVLLSGKKTAGVLVETVGAFNDWSAVVGVGINVNQSTFPGSAIFQHPPTSLLLETGREWDVSALAHAVVKHLVARAAQAWPAALADWRQRMAAGVVLRRGPETATLEGVDDAGAAIVRLPDGTSACWTSVDTFVAESASDSV